MEWKLVCLVESGRRELPQVRSNGDHLGLVPLHGLDGLVHHVVGHLGMGEQDIVDGIDLHRAFDADEDRAGLDIAQITIGLNLACRGYSRGFGNCQKARAADRDIDFAHFRRTEGEHEHVGSSGGEIVRRAHDVGNQHRLDIRLGETAGRENGA